MDTRFALWMMKDLDNCQYQITQVKQFWTDLFRRRHLLQQIMHKQLFALPYYSIFFLYFKEIYI